MTQHEKSARIFKAFCDPNRLKLLGMLQHGEKCACELLEQISLGQPTLSHHMKILCDAEIVLSRKIGKMILYTLNPAGIDFAKTLLNDITQIKGHKPSIYSLK